MKTRRVIACVLAVLLVAGLVPTPPQTTYAWAEEPETALELVEDEMSQPVDFIDGSDEVLDGDVEDEPDVEVQAVGVNVSGPRVVADASMEAEQVATWDCVWFGTYPQTEVTSADEVYRRLQGTSFDAKGDATVDGTKYRRISMSDATCSDYWLDDGYQSEDYRYFRYEPIKWRVLSVSSGTALVLADKALDNQFYNASDVRSVVWENSSIRSWLNGYDASENQAHIDYSDKGFIGTAFSSDERSAILWSDVRNENNTLDDTPAGNDTVDRVFLLSEKEVYNTSHGFAAYYSTRDEARRCKASDYAHAMGAWRSADIDYEGNCLWWLRSPGSYDWGAVYVLITGFVKQIGVSADYDNPIRPALTLSLASSSISYAGTVASGEGTSGQGQKTITSVTIGQASFIYDSKAKEPTVTVTASDKTVPVSGYDVTYKNNVNAGTATVTVTGKGDYVGTLTATFEIRRADVGKAQVTGVTDRTYNGKAQAQSPTVKVGGRTLKEGTDYVLSYKGNVNAGTATMTVKGTGNYTGSVSKTFKIAKAANPMTVKAVTRTAKAAKAKKKAQVVDAPLKFTKKAKGKVTYTRVTKGSSKKLSVNTKTGKVTVAKGTKKGKYKIKIKISTVGNANYKKADKTLACTIVVK